MCVTLKVKLISLSVSVLNTVLFHFYIYYSNKFVINFKVSQFYKWTILLHFSFVRVFRTSIHSAIGALVAAVGLLVIGNIFLVVAGDLS